MKLQHVTVVFNPKGGSASKGGLNHLLQQFHAAGIQTSSSPTTAAPNSARHLAAEAALSGTNLVIAMGGDGTVRSVAEGLIGTDTPMAIFPGGTGNLFARYFYPIPTPAQFVDMVLNGEAQGVDLMRYDCIDTDGVAQHGYSMVGLGFGCLSDAVTGGDPDWKKVFGQLVYAWKVVLAALSPRTSNATFILNGAEFSCPVSGAFALNVVPHLFSSISRGCSPSDGLMDFVLLKGRTFVELMSFAACLLIGSPQRSRYYARYRVANVGVKFDSSTQIQFDGDSGPVTSRVDLSVLRGAVRIILA